MTQSAGGKFGFLSLGAYCMPQAVQMKQGMDEISLACQSIIIGMRSDPEPNQIAVNVGRKRPLTKADPH